MFISHLIAIIIIMHNYGYIYSTKKEKFKIYTTAVMITCVQLFGITNFDIALYSMVYLV